MPKENAPDEKPFTSWKEIAAYLGCDERTCLRWEKQYKLPVHRAAGGTAKSHVFAYRDELDGWLGRRQKGEPGIPVLARVPGRSILPRRWPLYLILVLGTLAAILILSDFAGKKPRNEFVQPFDFRIEKSSLIIINSRGTELWHYDTGVEALADDASYHEHFGHRRIGPDEQNVLPLLQINDINDDRWAEVLFGIRTYDDGPENGVVCLDHHGRKLWAYEPGREMTFGSKRYSADYAVDAVDILETGRPGPKKILVIARHRPNYPSYVSVLSEQGKTLGEYWNSGRFSDYAVFDIDKDGLPALVLVGTNNEYGKGFLAIVDPDILWGASPQTGDFRCPDLRPGSELFYILFPRTAVDRLEFGPRECIASVDLLKQNRLMAIAFSSRIIYEFDDRMRIETAIISDAFREKYRKYQDAGKIPPGPLDEKALSESLVKSVIYYDGEGWTTTPTVNKKNLDFYHQKEIQAKQALKH